MSSLRTYTFPFASIPAFRITLLMILGIILSAKTSFGVFLSGCLLIFCFIIWLTSETVIRKKAPLTGSFLANSSYLLLICISLTVYTEIRNCIETYEIKPGDKINLYEWDELLIEGVAESAGISSSGRWVYVVRVKKTFIDDNNEW